MLVSIVIPVLNEEENIVTLYDRIAKSFFGRKESLEIVFVDDGSTDSTLEKIRALKDKKGVRYVSFSRNFGHQKAISAGLKAAKGDVVVIIDADLQDPPEIIPSMIMKWEQGYEVVFAKRKKRMKEGGLKKGLAFCFYRIFSFLSPVKIPIDAGDFCLYDRKVVDVLNNMPEIHRYVRGMRAWVGFKQAFVEFDRNPRDKGKAKYTFKKSLAMAMDATFSFSQKPLHLATILGLLSALLGVLLIFIVCYWRVRYPSSQLTGTAIIFIVILFLGSVQLISIGIIGEYVGRIFEEIKNRPLYVIKETD